MTSCCTRISDVTACMAGTPPQRLPHWRAASSMGSNGRATHATLVDGDDGARRRPSVDAAAAEPGPLHDPLDRHVPLVGTTDVPHVADALLLGGGLEAEVAEAEQPAVQRSPDGDVEDPGQRHRGQALAEHAVHPED